MRSVIGRIFGTYEVIELIGRGGMAEVYKAYDPALKRHVAIKVLSEQLARDPRAADRFVVEAQNMARLDHPNILPIYAYGEQEDFSYFVMKLIEGGTLKDLIRAPLAFDQAVLLAAQIAGALGYAHQQGIVHRDVKPANVLMFRPDWALLSDLGIARVLDQASQYSSTKMVGTPHYMAPEQALGKPVSPKTDQYALGIVLYEMLTGEPPYRADTPMALAAQHIHSSLPPPRERNPDIPESVEQVAVRALEKDPSDRFSDMTAFALALHAAVGQEASTSAAAPSTVTGAQRIAIVSPDATARLDRAGREKKPSSPYVRKVQLGATPFIGRESEAAEVGSLLQQRGIHLVTLTGPGGIGKTRLALHVAAALERDFSDGVVFVPLDSITDPSLVASTIAGALGVRETGEDPLLDTLTEYLREKQLLLMLDNFEQVVEAAPVLADLLASCRRLKILVTSRAVLRLSTEYEFSVSPLSIPGPGDAQDPELLMHYDSVVLFVQRAQAVKPGFALTVVNASAVIEICRRLDGLPLALELAAARITLLAPKALLGRLDNRMKLLTGGARDLPERRQTLRGAIDWSYSLLDSQEQQLFTRLAVFVGGFVLDAAEAVCHVDGGLDVLAGLASLLDNSLLRTADQQDDEQRFALLQTIREYALERLAASGDEEAVRQAHAVHFCRFAEEAAPKLIGPEQESWLQRLEIEHDNLRAALQWLIDAVDTQLALRLAAALGQFWEIRGYLSEGRRWFDEVLAGSGGAPDSVRAQALTELGALSLRQGDYERAAQLYEECLTVYRGLGDDQGIAGSLNNLAMIAHQGGKYSQAEALHEEALALQRALGDRWGTATSLNNMGIVALDRGDLPLARSRFEESLTIYRQLGDRRGIASVLTNLGVVSLDVGDFTSTGRHFQESLAIYRPLGDRRGIANALNYLGIVAQHDGDYRLAASLHGESLAIHRELGDMDSIAECLGELATLAGAQGDAEEAARLFGLAEALRSALGSQLPLAAQFRYDRSLAAARAKLGESAWEAALSEGRAMTMDHVMSVLDDIVPVGAGPAPAQE